MPRGGYRPGSGRKQLDKPRVRKLILAHEEEWDIIKASADKAGLSVNEYMIRRALRRRIDAKQD